MFQNCDKYLEFATLIDQLQFDVAQIEVNSHEIKLDLVHLQQFFREQIVSLPDIDSLEQPYRTEISKQLHLLEMDVMFFQAARQPITAKNRLKSIAERLGLIRKYVSSGLDQKIIQ